MKWIKTSDRLPEKTGTYIVTHVCNDGEFVQTELNFTVEGFKDPFDGDIIEPKTFYEAFEQSYYDSYWTTYITDYNVIAWMPYPEPYNPAEEES